MSVEKNNIPHDKSNSLFIFICLETVCQVPMLHKKTHRIQQFDFNCTTHHKKKKKSDRTFGMRNTNTSLLISNAVIASFVHHKKFLLKKKQKQTLNVCVTCIE